MYIVYFSQHNVKDNHNLLNNMLNTNGERFAIICQVIIVDM